MSTGGIHGVGRREGYDATGKGYEHGRYGSKSRRLYLAIRSAALLDVISQEANAERQVRVLEVGCGTGLSLEYLARNLEGFELVGTDFSRTMLQQAQEKLTSAGQPGKTVLADAFHLPFDSGHFDVLFATRFIHQFPQADKIRMVKELRRVVRKGGLLMIEFYGRPYHMFRYLTRARHGPRSEGRRTWDVDMGEFLSHYPTRREVREIFGGEYRLVPLKTAGFRWVRFLLGESLARRTVSMSRHVRTLVDEYFVVVRN